jgi:hypothetical protein
MSEVFKKLNAVNVNEHTEKKNGLTYLSWAWAWAEVKKIYPLARYIIKMFDGKPYLYDENLGYMVMTEVSIENETQTMYLPVMDGANKAMKSIKYEYEVNEWGFVNGKRQVIGKITKYVEPATMFDINTAIQRCLVKNLAMFGLGLYIYAGEDLPQENINFEEKLKEKLKTKGFSDFVINTYIEQEAPDEPLQKSLLSNEKDFTDSLKAFANAMITSIKTSIEASQRADLIEEMNNCKKLNDFERLYNLI